jgi:dolichol kinase
VSLSINHKSACVLLTAFVVVLQIADDNDDDDDDGAFSTNHISATRGLLVALTICICFYSSSQLRSSDAYGALALPWFLILHSSSSSTRMWWLTDVSLLSSFSYIFLRRRHTSSRRSSTAQSSTRMSLGGTWLSRCDPIYSLAKMLARNAGSKETDLGVLFLCMQGLSIASVSIFYDLIAYARRDGITWLPWSRDIQKRDERVLVSAFVAASCWLSFLLLTTPKTRTTFHQYILACVGVFEMFLSVGILKALVSPERGDNAGSVTLTAFNIARLAALWCTGVCFSLALFCKRRALGKEKIFSQRKIFHAIAVVMFGVPMHIWRDDYGQVLIPVAFAACLVLFCSVECLRVSKRLSKNITRMIFAWEKEKKRSNEDGVVLSHSSLLLGIAFPLWLHHVSGSSNNSCIKSLSGLISVGIGDTFACEIGCNFGTIKMNDASTKTFEGFLAFFVSTFATALLLASNEDEYSTGKIAIACVAAALSECTLESTLDNVVIPLVFLAFL